MRKYLCSAGVALFPCLLSLSSGAWAASEAPPVKAVLVKYKSEALARGFTRAAPLAGVRAADPVTRDGALVRYDLNGMTPEAAVAHFAADPAVAYAEPDYPLRMDASPNDPDLEKQWALFNVDDRGNDVRALDAWNLQTGDSHVLLGMIDSGVDYRHEDLQDNLWINPREIPNNGRDDDGNGYVDDIYGVNVVNRSGDPMDANKHGTHVAGIMAAVGNNGLGGVGVNWRGSLVTCAFIDEDGFGYTSDAIACMDYMVDLKGRGEALAAINNSWGGGAPGQAMEEAVRRVEAAGVLMVFSAGNDGRNNDHYGHFPSNYDNPAIVAVASTDREGELSGFSNYGLEKVHIAAPGSDIYSTLPNHAYGSLSGTSMAAPMITGTLGLMAAHNPELDAQALKQALLDGADRIAALQGKIPDGRRLNLEKALLAADDRPGFRIAPETDVVDIPQGEMRSLTARLQPLFDWRGMADLSVSQPQAGVYVQLPRALQANESGDLTFSVGAETPVGRYFVELKGVESDKGSQPFKSAKRITVNVLPQGTRDFDYANGEATPIPDHHSRGLWSPMLVNENLNLWDAAVSLDISHPWRGDLQVNLLSPDGQSFRLRERGGLTEDDLVRSYRLPQMRNIPSQGLWFLQVIDASPFQEGVLNHWEMRLRGQPQDGAQLHELTLSTGDVTLPKGEITEITLPQHAVGKIKGVAVDLAISGAWLGEYTVTLTSPAGTEYVLHDKNGSFNDYDLQLADHFITDFHDENAAGAWKIQVARIGLDDKALLRHGAIKLYIAPD
ncbi:Subtilisin-like serine protease [Hahella chejuensis KCTC 2396]|uniref:Subtilisin-like serine protease n=1 Tax=Hahella chejuensis (strain KCTC 2396) TaxID=349521 RepID=Q2SHX4_HAHCH|nr:S8 family serine peptidase [Hahella chejuensis]ABC29750.1 Subtilisin-like serine protease [Hahella chejuensis KCTC 2396]